MLTCGPRKARDIPIHALGKQDHFQRSYGSVKNDTTCKDRLEKAVAYVLKKVGNLSLPPALEEYIGKTDGNIVEDAEKFTRVLTLQKMLNERDTSTLFLCFENILPGW